MSPEHKILDALQHLWPYLAGVMAAIIGGFKLWWSDRRSIRQRMVNVEKIAEHAVTEDRLRECKGDVDKTNESILGEIRAIREDMREDNRLNTATHDKLMTAILDLHK